jgi:hypothetical protein
MKARWDDSTGPHLAGPWPRPGGSVTMAGARGVRRGPETRRRP